METADQKYLSALQLFASDQTVSFVWADRSGLITRNYGIGVPTAEPGMQLSDALPMFVGLESDLADLIADPGKTLDVPNIAAVKRVGGQVNRLNLSARWDPVGGEYIILVVRAMSHAAFELELQQQVRARRVAESMLLDQAESIQATNAALAQVNRDLAEFARVVSHDLKAPMRAMRYFADDLETSLTDPGVGDPQTHIDRMRAQSRRMTSMLSSLLAYASLERKKDAVCDVDTQELVETIVASLPLPTGLTIEVRGDWPVMMTIGALLDVVLRNLIENATRYAEAKPAGVLVEAQKASDHLTIYVRDTGPGIPERLRDAAFKPFTQLDPADGQGSSMEQGGHTGMGLAVVKQAVTSADGTITIEDGVPEFPGACFKVIWPGKTVHQYA